MKLTKLLLIFIFSFVVFTACSSERPSSQVSDDGVASSSISSTTAVLSTTTSSTTTTVPTYTGPLYPQLFIDATDGESCSWLGGDWTFGPPGWGEYCDAGLLLLASNSDLCEQFGYVWSEELQRCEKLEEDKDACIDGGGVWALVGNATFECRSDEGTIETAYSQDVCLERGGTWSETNDCYEDDGSVWDARYQDTCIDRGGTWSPVKHVPHPEREHRWTRCVLDSGETQYAFDELTCGSRGGIWKIDPHAYYEYEYACFSYETEYELEDLFDSDSDWKNVVLRNWEGDVLHNCENSDEALNQLSGFIISRSWLQLVWEVDDFSCRDLTSQPFEDLHRSFRSMVNDQGEETVFYVLTWPWVDLLEVLDIEGLGFANFARIHDISSKGDVLFSGWQRRQSHGVDGLFIMSSDGTNRRRLFESCSGYCTPLSFSPDGESFLHFETYNGSISTPLYQFDLEGNLIRTLNPDADPQTIIENVSVSPSGAHIAYWMATDPVLRPNLFVADFQGSPIQQLTDFDPMDFYSFRAFGGSSIAWSLDETQIGFCLQEFNWRDDFYTHSRDNCKKQFAVSTSASSTNGIEEISLETYELWVNQQQ